MSDLDILRGKKILIVDDEPDVLEVLRELLPNSEVTTCSTFESALNVINNHSFDLAVLDIMGVNGFALLEATRKRKLPSAMLTAHALNAESINVSIRLGALSFLPKEEIGNFPTLIAEIFTDLKEGKTHWDKLFKRLGRFFKTKAGILLEELEKPSPHPPFHV